MKSSFGFFDNFSYKPNFLIYGRDSYKTLPTSILGIISYLTMLIFSTYFFVDSLKRENMVIIYNEKSTVYPIINFTEIPMMFTLNDGINNFIDESLYYINPVIVEATETSFDFTSMKMKKCSEANFGQYGDYFTNYTNLENIYCFSSNENNFTLKGISSDYKSGYTYVNLYLSRCVNSTSHNICKSPEIIESALKNVFLELYFFNYMIDHENVYNPLQLFLARESFSMSSTIFKRYFYGFQNIVYETDYGYIFQDKESLNKFQQSSYLVNVDLKKGAIFDEGAFGQITFRPEKKIGYYKRIFPKLQTALANMGGVVKVIQVVSMSFGYFLSKKMFIADISNKFKILDNEHEEKGNDNSKLDILKFNFSTHGKILEIAGTQKKLQYPLIKLNYFDVICVKPFYNKKNFVKIQKSENILNNIFSFEYYLKVCNEKDRLISILFDEDEKNLFYGMDGFKIYNKTIQKPISESLRFVKTKSNLLSQKLAEIFQNEMLHIY
jgi:hypothetical protein